MKTIFLHFGFLFAILAGSVASGQTNQVQQRWTVTVKVLGEDGNPIEDANTWVAYYLPSHGGEANPGLLEWDKIQGLTDANGMFVASHPDTRSISLGIHVEKTGYYHSYRNHEFAKFQDSDPARWNPSVTLVLKRKENPIPMYAKWIVLNPLALKTVGKPPVSFSETLGYDLMLGDWVAPYGKGQTAGIILTEQFNKQSITDYDYKLTMTFPDAGDGIQEYITPDLEEGSALRSPQKAPTDGYQPQLIRESYHHPGQPGKSDYDENRIYLFRVTLSDGVHYGKIYGDPEQMPFCYYLNPTPNDRDIEFDPEHNLMKLKRYDLHVSAP